MNKQAKNRLKLGLSLTAILLATAAAVSSTFAWLAISRTPIVSDLGLTIVTDSRLEIAPDVNGQPGEWELSLDLSNLLSDIAPLRPVTYSKENKALYATLYDVDGRNTGKTVALSDEQHANVKASDVPVGTNVYGYYMAVTFWVRGPQEASISLAKATEIREGVAGSGTYILGNPVWDEETNQHINGGRGLETAIRLGFRCVETDFNGRPIGDTTFTVYEPNCDKHVNGEDGYVETQSIDGGALADEKSLVRQTASSWKETSPALSDEVIYDFGEFQDETKLFRVSAKSMVKVTLYLWLEGRDVDCINFTSSGATSILGSIQFTSEGGYGDSGIGRD